MSAARSICRIASSTCSHTLRATAARCSTGCQIQRAVWGYRHDPGTNVVDVYIGYVRRKLVTADGPLVTITTVRSRGYRLEHPSRMPVPAPRAAGAVAVRAA